MTLNTGNVVKKPAVVIDPNFFVPPNVIDIRYKNETDFNGTEINSPARYTTPESEGEFDNLVEGDEIGYDFPVEPVDDSLPVPSNITVISQSPHLGPGGAVLVDLVIDIPDMPGVTDVDVRVTRI